MYSIELPEYPKVFIEGDAIIICYENKQEEVWGYESNKKLAEEIARDIEIGLKVIKYASIEVMSKLSEIRDCLITLNIPVERVNEYLFEGYIKAAIKFKEVKHEQAIPN